MKTALHGLRFAKTMQGLFCCVCKAALCSVSLICCGANLFYEPQELCLSGIGAFENTCVQQNLFKDCSDFLLNDRFRIFRIGFGVACADFLQPWHVTAERVSLCQVGIRIQRPCQYRQFSRQTCRQDSSRFLP